MKKKRLPSGPDDYHRQPKTAQDRPKTAQDRPKTPQERKKTSNINLSEQEREARNIDLNFQTLLRLGCSCVPFLKLLGVFVLLMDAFWVLLGASWVRPGASWMLLGTSPKNPNYI